MTETSNLKRHQALLSLVFCPIVFVGMAISFGCLIFLIYSVWLFETQIKDAYFANPDAVHSRVIYSDARDDWAYGLTVDFISPLVIVTITSILVSYMKPSYLRWGLLSIAAVWLCIWLGNISLFSGINDFLE